MTKPLHPLPQARLDHAAEILHALANPLRLAIVQQISQLSHATVVDLQATLGHEPSMLSNHLRLLRQAGLVRTERAGKFIRYRLAETRIEEIAAAVTAFGACVAEVSG